MSEDHREDALSARSGVPGSELRRFRIAVRNTSPPDDMDWFLSLSVKTGLICRYKTEPGLFSDIYIVQTVDGKVEEFPDSRTVFSFLRGWSLGAFYMMISMREGD